MSLDELKFDIITAVRRITDERLLSDIKQRLSNQSSAPSWQSAVVEIRSGQTFEDIFREQGCPRPTFATFAVTLEEEAEWEVSLDDLLDSAD